MELMRRIAPGRLSEIFGSVALKNDNFFAGLGIEEALKGHCCIDKKKSKLSTNNGLSRRNQSVLDEGKTNRV
jgi:penicillin amidase